MPEFDALSVLRRECRSLHRQLERKDTFARLLKNDVEIPDYVSALKVLFRFVSSFEARLVSLVEATPFSEIYTPRLPLLRADLNALQEILPIHDDPPHGASSVEDACGLVYMMEGASLGSAIIRAHLTARLGNDLPLGYFGLHAEEIGRWERVTGRLDEMLPDETSAARAAASAADAFRVLISMASPRDP